MQTGILSSPCQQHQICQRQAVGRVRLCSIISRSWVRAGRSLHANIGRQSRLGGQTRHGRRQQGCQAQLHGGDWSTASDSYVTLGLAHCFEKTDNGKLRDHFVIEPISANALECMAAGAKTCFRHVTSTVYSDAVSRDRTQLPAEFAQGLYCEEFDFRCGASARTWQRPHAQDNLLDIVPLGQVKSNFNYNVDEKRVLNFENVVSDDDNVKQDMSIDVYGRKKEEDEEQSKAAAAAVAGNGNGTGQEVPADAKPAEAEDELESLLSV